MLLLEAESLAEGRLGEPNWPTRVLVVMRPTDAVLRTHGHPWAATIPILCNFLINAGFEVELSDNLDRIKNPEDTEGLNSFDVVIFHGKHEQSDDQAVDALHDFVHGGKGLIVIHIASASFAPNENEISIKWRDLIGSAWVYAPPENPIGSFHPEPPLAITVNVTEPQHPIMAGIPSEFKFAKEELYQNTFHAPDGPGIILANGTDIRDQDGQTKVFTEPVAFALERGRGRVFHSYVGHFISTHLDWRFQKMITQGIEWAARR